MEEHSILFINISAWCLPPVVISAGIRAIFDFWGTVVQKVPIMLQVLVAFVLKEENLPHDTRPRHSRAHRD